MDYPLGFVLLSDGGKTYCEHSLLEARALLEDGLVLNFADPDDGGQFAGVFLRRLQLPQGSNATDSVGQPGKAGGFRRQGLDIAINRAGWGGGERQHL